MAVAGVANAARGAGLARQPSQTNGRSLADVVATRIREMVIQGAFSPGQHLSEGELSGSLDVSRNTLREVFRVLTKEGLLRHELNRGVFVAAPDMSSVIDLYRLRRMIECRAIEQAPAGHPAIRRMRAAVADARQARERDDWIAVGSADLVFHTAIIALADSRRLAAFFSQIMAETRLAFGLLSDPEFLHAPFIEMNDEILQLVEEGKLSDASVRLDKYLVTAERVILGAFARS